MSCGVFLGGLCVIMKHMNIMQYHTWMIDALEVRGVF